jgi:hypothetical protein
VGETSTVFNFLAQISFNTNMTRRVSRQLLTRRNWYQNGAPSEQCVLALNGKSVGVTGAIFAPHRFPIDHGRLTAVIVSRQPLMMGMQLLESHPLLFTALLAPTDPFPPECSGLIKGRKARDTDPALWSLARAFIRTLPYPPPSDTLHVARMATKRDSPAFEVKRVSFSLDSWHHVRLKASWLRECVVGGGGSGPVDCRDPINHWIKPAVCPKRCLRSSVSLCDNVVACPIPSGGTVFVAVESRPFQWAGGWLGKMDGRVKAQRQDRYVAYHVCSKRQGFGWWGTSSQFHLLFSFERANS